MNVHSSWHLFPQQDMHSCMTAGHDGCTVKRRQKEEFATRMGSLDKRTTHPSKHRQIHDFSGIFKLSKNSMVLLLNVAASNASNGTKPRKRSFTTSAASAICSFRSEKNRTTIDNCCVPLMSRHSSAINA